MINVLVYMEELDLVASSFSALQFRGPRESFKRGLIDCKKIELRRLQSNVFIKFTC